MKTTYPLHGVRALLFCQSGVPFPIGDSPMKFASNRFQACDPVEAIQQYAHRVSGRGSKKELKDLPENIGTILIGA